jgi:hypothetical protein
MCVTNTSEEMPEKKHAVDSTSTEQQLAKRQRKRGMMGSVTTTLTDTTISLADDGSLQLLFFARSDLQSKSGYFAEISQWPAEFLLKAGSKVVVAVSKPPVSIVP